MSFAEATLRSGIGSLAGRFGRVAVEAILEGKGDVMTGWGGER